MKNEIKIALVTGGSRGLGKNMALELAKKGLHLILTYNNNEEKAKEVIKEIERLGQQAIAVQLNVTEFNNFEEFFATVKKSIKSKFGVKKSITSLIMRELE